MSNVDSMPGINNSSHSSLEMELPSWDREERLRLSREHESASVVAQRSRLGRSQQMSQSQFRGQSQSRGRSRVGSTLTNRPRVNQSSQSNFQNEKNLSSNKISSEEEKELILASNYFQSEKGINSKMGQGQVFEVVTFTKLLQNKYVANFILSNFYKKVCTIASQTIPSFYKNSKTSLEKALVLEKLEKYAMNLTIGFIENNQLKLLKYGNVFGFYVDNKALGFVNTKGDVFIPRINVEKWLSFVAGRNPGNNVFVNFMALVFKENLNLRFSVPQETTGGTLASKAGSGMLNVVGRVAQSPLGVVGTLIRTAGGGKKQQNPIARFGNWLCDGGGVVYNTVSRKNTNENELKYQPTLEITFNPLKFDFISSAVLIQHQLTKELELWNATQSMPLIQRLPIFIGEKILRFFNFFSQKKWYVKVPGLEVGLEWKERPPNNPLLLKKAPEEVVPDAVINKGWEEGGPVIQAEFKTNNQIISIEDVTKDFSTSKNDYQVLSDDVQSIQESIKDKNVFPLLSRTVILKNTRNIEMKGKQTSFSNTEFKDLILSLNTGKKEVISSLTVPSPLIIPYRVGSFFIIGISLLVFMIFYYFLKENQKPRKRKKGRGWNYFLNKNQDSSRGDQDSSQGNQDSFEDYQNKLNNLGKSQDKK